MQVLVTGGTGFVGSHLVDALLEKKCGVRCLVRKTSNRQWLTGKNIDWVECEQIDDPQAAAQAIDGAELVFHVAGTLTAPNLQKYEEVNVKSTQVLLDACRGQSQLKRFVLIGSHGAAGPNPAGVERISEADPCAPVSDYGRSKLKAEEVTRPYGEEVPYTILRLCAMYGPRDANFLKFFASAHKKGKFPKVGKGPHALNLAHVTDIVEGIYQAAVNDSAINQTYFLASEELYSFDDVQAALSEAIGRKVTHYTIPNWVVQGMMLYADLLAIFGKHVLLNRDRLKTLSYPRWACDVSKAKTDFDFRQTISLKEGFRRTYQWYVENGWV